VTVRRCWGGGVKYEAGRYTIPTARRAMVGRYLGGL
jgi:hypothetical protein